ncbi:hypothetical protein BpHYR1_022981 [Brachionus plicatilis]|uniref:Uncharacterized protein n=1 Tax=Brachionus plicatilis TaxID=10195 RepID=A0A3M7SKY7_BRAPC|nr:hypothetical protein BpHYR1_022981 [Brachionus plicatilis]
MNIRNKAIRFGQPLCIHHREINDITSKSYDVVMDILSDFLFVYLQIIYVKIKYCYDKLFLRNFTIFPKKYEILQNFTAKKTEKMAICRNLPLYF